jgi:ribonuclease T2
VRFTPLILALAALPAPALAQAYQCRVPPEVIRTEPPRQNGPAVLSEIGGYVLAVSWSPEFCRGSRASDADNYQCNGKIGRFGFVLHGLWPESVKGPDPQWCTAGQRPSQEDLRANLCMTPVPWLIEHEWAKHGTCMSPTPAAYFKASAILWNSLKLPDADRLSRRKYLTAGDLRRAFAARNPAFPLKSVGIRLSNGGWLRELYLCYGKDFMPRACAAKDLGPRDTTPVKIWRGL